MKKLKKKGHGVVSADEGLKRWTRKEFETRENFDFIWVKQWPLHGLRIAWLWEIDRELRSGNLPFAIAWKIARTKEWCRLIEGNPDITEAEWQKLEREYFTDDDNVCPPTENPKRSVKFLSFRELLRRHPEAHEWNVIIAGGHTQIFSLEIDLESSKHDILRNFWQEVEQIKGATTRINPKKRKGEAKSVGLKDYIAWFRDLSINRLSQAGFRSKEQMNMLPDEVQGKLTHDFSNWNHKKTATRKRILKRRTGLQFYAKVVSTDGNLKESPHWFDHFIRL